jgi:hypothetical protein
MTTARCAIAAGLRCLFSGERPWPILAGTLAGVSAKGEFIFGFRPEGASGGFRSERPVCLET